MRKYISTLSVKIEKSTISSLKAHCKNKRLDPKNMFLYYENDSLHVGFSSEVAHHIKMEDKQWLPFYEC